MLVQAYRQWNNWRKWKWRSSSRNTENYGKNYERIFQMEMDSKNHKNETVENEANVLNEWQIHQWMNDKYNLTNEWKIDKNMTALNKGPSD